MSYRGYNVYFDVQPHETGCATIIKSPANTDIIGCGVVIGAFKQPACAMLSLETSFMVQSCCGDACDSAGAKMIRGLGPMGSIRSVSIDGNGGLLLKSANGSIIEPAEIGPPPELKEKRSLQKRSCTKNSWQGGSTYTKPADNVQIVASNVAGPGTVTITKERTQTWSTSMSLGIADVLSLGVSAEFSESVSSSKSVTRELAEGQSGNMGFTAYLTCSEGKGQCDSGEVEGEVCCKCISVIAKPNDELIHNRAYYGWRGRHGQVPAYCRLVNHILRFGIGQPGKDRQLRDVQYLIGAGVLMCKLYSTW